jgi:RNA polymerase sigma-70 factor (ECF subfamily)
MTLPPRSSRLAAAPEDERKLIARSAAGDAAAFRVLVERHQARAYALALRFVRSAPDAEDVTQEAFVKAWNALPRFKGESLFGTWLHRIVARCALDRAEVLQRRRKREAHEDAAEHVSIEAPQGDAMETARVHALLQKLSEAQRLVVTLFYFEDRSVEEVAAQLGMNENTVKTHLSRARAAMRGAWVQTMGESA